jgi:hypothetical protein
MSYSSQLSDMKKTPWAKRKSITPDKPQCAAATATVGSNSAYSLHPGEELANLPIVLSF